MRQLGLFGAAEGVVLDDASGQVLYTRAFLSAAEADAWFAQLRRDVPWQAERRRMYDRDVDVPRLTAFYRLTEDAGVASGSAEVAPGPPPAVRAAASRVIAHTGVAFDTVGLNLYRDGRDSVAPHGDHLTEIAEGCPIALVSLGAVRRMTIRARPPRRLVREIELEPGSLLLMSYESQRHYTHAVPKTTEAVGARISLAFRVKPANPAGRGRYR